MSEIKGEFWITVQGHRSRRDQPPHKVIATNLTQKRPPRLGVDETCFKVDVTMDTETFDPVSQVIKLTIPAAQVAPAVAEVDQDASRLR
jgi:hypothetical protein